MDSLAQIEPGIDAARRDVAMLRQLSGQSAHKCTRRLCRIEAPVSAGYNTYNVTWLNGTFLEAAGANTPTYSNRQMSAKGVVHNLAGPDLAQINDIAVAYRIRGRWWIRLVAPGEETEQQNIAGYWNPGGGAAVPIFPSANIGYLLFPPYTTPSRASGFVRFSNVNIAQGATVGSATIYANNLSFSLARFVYANGGIPGGTPIPPDGTYAARGTIVGEDVDNAISHASAAAFDAAARTTASQVYYEGGSLVSGVFTPDHAVGTNTSYDVTNIVQEIVNRAGWVSGNTMQFFFDESGSNFTAPFASPTYGTWSTYAATLVLGWS